MSEHPPIPDEAWQAVANHYSEWRLGFNNIERDALRVAAQVLWREWTRGMAVVPLPEPDGEMRMWTVKGSEWSVGEWTVTGYFDGVSERIDISVNGDGYGFRGAARAREIAARILAAADRAEQLAAEQAIARTKCGADAGQNWFDRELCPEPCGSMHTRCIECGYPQGGCVNLTAAEQAEAVTE